MTGKIFRSTIFVAAVVLLCSFGVIMGVLYDYFDGVQLAQLKDELELAATATEQQGMAYLKAVESSRFRVTWVDGAGMVLYDSQADENTMENHADREEIRSALETGYGSSTRQSATLTEKTVYQAKRLSDGTVLRIGISAANSATLFLGMLQPICVVIFIAIVLSAVLSHRMSRRITQPINMLDLEHPMQNDCYEEIAPLLQRIHQQHLQIASQMRKLQRKTDELEQITGNMSEGLMLMDRDGIALSINPAADALLGSEQSWVGKSYMAFAMPDMRSAIDRAFIDGSAEFRASRDGKEYQISVNRIVSDNKVIGAVLLAFDVTETRNAERSRREFSANVSHELKTPLQSIIGSAELLENGMVKPEDTPRFVGHIRKEAARLVDLVEDIIRLSQLDEGVQIPGEDVDLYAVAKEAKAVLQNAANAKGISFVLEGESTVVSGVPRLLQEIAYNLCDNAVKYTPAGGSVTVTVKEKTLTVADTGIGIPAEHQDRIFERFYRVDKSHSKQSGGTGLGLSIVKHAVQYHRAKLTLASTPGEGTTVTVTFP